MAAVNGFIQAVLRIGFFDGLTPTLSKGEGGSGAILRTAFKVIEINWPFTTHCSEGPI